MEKSEMVKIVLNYLRKNPKTQLAAIRNSVDEVLKSQGITGTMTSYQGGGTISWHERMSDEDSLLCNEIVYDLISERIITPGVNRDNLELPFLHVNNEQKLIEKIEELE